MPFNTVVAVFGYLPFVALMEWGIVFIPLIFHSLYGFVIAAEMQGPGGNLSHYAYGRNWLYWLQRWSGVIAFAYIAYHVYDTWGLKHLFAFQSSDEAGFRAISYDAMMWRFASVGYLLIYVVGILATVFHFANGLFNFGIRWGITIGKEAQRISAGVWSLVGIVLTLIGVGTAVNFHLKSVQPQDKFQGQTVRQKFPNLDDLVKGDTAPADPTPASKPVPGPGGVMNPTSESAPDAAPATTPSVAPTAP